jgi:hypothetical protein
MSSIGVLEESPRAPGSTPLYSCLPLAWGTAGGDILDPLYLWDQKWILRKRKLIYKILKERGTPFQGVLYKKFINRGLTALVDHQKRLAQPANPLLRFQPRIGDKPVVRNLLR